MHIASVNWFKSVGALLFPVLALATYSYKMYDIMRLHGLNLSSFFSVHQNAYSLLVFMMGLLLWIWLIFPKAIVAIWNSPSPISATKNSAELFGDVYPAKDIIEIGKKQGPFGTYISVMTADRTKHYPILYLNESSDSIIEKLKSQLEA